MLTRGAIAGLIQGRHRTVFSPQWSYLCMLQTAQEIYHETSRDLLSYRAHGGRPGALKLIQARLELMGKQLGRKIDAGEIINSRENDRAAKYESWLEEHYNLTKQEAARIMESAMSQEAQPYGVQRRRRR